MNQSMRYRQRSEIGKAVDASETADEVVGLLMVDRRLKWGQTCPWDV